MRSHRAFVRWSVALLLVATVGCGVRGGREQGTLCRGAEPQLRTDSALVVGTDVGRTPFAFTDPGSGELTGFEVELVREIGSRVGLEVRFTNQTTPGLVPSLVARRFDLVASQVRTSADMLEQVCLSQPYLDANLALLVGAASAADGMDVLTEGSVVAVEEGSVGAAWAARNLADVRVVTRPTLTDVLDDVSDREVTAAVVDLAVARHASGQGLGVASEIDTGEHYALAFHPDNAGLRTQLGEILDQMRADGTLDGLVERWFG